MKFMMAFVVYSILAAQLAVAQTAPATPAAPKPATPATPAAQAKAPEAGAAKPVESEPTVDQILDRYIQALGGREAIEKITSRAIKATFEIASMGLQGGIEIYAKAPNKLLTLQTIPGVGLLRDGYDGQVAWAENPMAGLREKSGPELARVALLSDFYAPLRTKQRYQKLELKGKEKLGEREAWVILATPPDGSPIKLYYDTQTGLQARMDLEVDTPQGRVPIETTVEDYRDVDGVKLPFLTRQDSPMAKAVIKLTEVKSNVAIDDARFKKPAGQ